MLHKAHRAWVIGHRGNEESGSSCQVVNLLTLHTEAAHAATPGGVRHTSPLGGELDQPEASTAQKQELIGKHMHPVISLCLTINLLSVLSLGYITGGESSKYWSNSSHVL